MNEDIIRSIEQETGWIAKDVYNQSNGRDKVRFVKDQQVAYVTIYEGVDTAPIIDMLMGHNDDLSEDNPPKVIVCDSLEEFHKICQSFGWDLPETAYINRERHEYERRNAYYLQKIQDQP